MQFHHVTLYVVITHEVDHLNEDKLYNVVYVQHVNDFLPISFHSYKISKYY